MTHLKNRGFTLIELVIALVLGLVVLGAALRFVVTTYRTSGGDAVREEVYRNARFVGMSLERDVDQAGVGLTSSTAFGTLATWNDTVVILRIPYTTSQAPVHNLVPPAGTNNPLNPGGTCGTYCVDVKKNGTFDLNPGDLARLQVSSTLHLILVQSVTQKDTGTMSVTFTNDTILLHFAAGLAGGMLLDRFSTFVQKLAPTVYWVQNNQLMRATGLNPGGSLTGLVMAYNVQSLKDSLVFSDGHIAPQADPTGTDTTSSLRKVVGIVMNGALTASGPDPRVNGGALFTRSYRWRFSPRNLMWQNRKGS